MRGMVLIFGLYLVGAAGVSADQGSGHTGGQTGGTPSGSTSTSYRQHIVGKESGGDYAIYNKLGHTQALGLYQFIPSTFAGLGYMTYTGGSKSQWSSYTFNDTARAAGVSNVEDLRHSSAGHTMQDAAFDKFTEQNWSALGSSTRGLVGSSVGSVPVTREGLLSTAHFLGAGGANRWAESGFDASVLPYEVVTANGFGSYAELQNYLMKRMADAFGTTHVPGTTYAGYASGGEGMYESTSGFPGLTSKRPVQVREVPPFHGQLPTLRS